VRLSKKITYKGTQSLIHLCRSKETNKSTSTNSKLLGIIRRAENQVKIKFYQTDLTRSPLLNACLVLKGTDTSDVPMRSPEGVGDSGGSETTIIITWMLIHEEVDLIKKNSVF